ncbi:ACYP1 [Anthophora retusa]
MVSKDTGINQPEQLIESQLATSSQLTFYVRTNAHSAFSPNNDRMLTKFYLKIVLCLLVALPLLSEVTSQNNDATMTKLVGVDFEVYGRVQGVFFRKYTQKRSTELGLKGWCMNTDKGTVVGRIEGEKEKVELMKDWLRHTGSPQSAIDKAEFKNEKELSQPSFTNFHIKK